MFEFEQIKIYHYMAWKNRGLFFQKIEVFFLKQIEVFFFANRPLQGFNPLTKVYWKIRELRKFTRNTAARPARHPEKSANSDEHAHASTKPRK